MATVTFGGAPTHTVGELPVVGSLLPQFTLTGADLHDVSSADFVGKRIVLNIFPSVDTGVCAMSVRRFNELAASWPNTVVVCVSKDLPFALGRFCGAEGIENVIVTSDFRTDFGHDFGIQIADGDLRGLLARSVVIADERGNIVYTRLSPEIGEEPDYDQAASAVLG